MGKPSCVNGVCLLMGPNTSEGLLGTINTLGYNFYGIFFVLQKTIITRPYGMILKTKFEEEKNVKNSRQEPIKV